MFEDGDEVTPEALRELNLAKGRYDVLKVLGDGELTKKLKISAHRFSKSALEKIQKAGGEAIVLPRRPRSSNARRGRRRKPVSDSQKKQNNERLGSK